MISFPCTQHNPFRFGEPVPQAASDDGVEPVCLYRPSCCQFPRFSHFLHLGPWSKLILFLPPVLQNYYFSFPSASILLLHNHPWRGLRQRCGLLIAGCLNLHIKKWSVYGGIFDHVAVLYDGVEFSQSSAVSTPIWIQQLQTTFCCKPDGMLSNQKLWNRSITGVLAHFHLWMNHCRAFRTSDAKGCILYFWKQDLGSLKAGCEDLCLSLKFSPEPISAGASEFFSASIFFSAVSVPHPYIRTSN